MNYRHNAGNHKMKEVSNVKFIATSNPALPSVEGLTRKHIHHLQSDEVLKRFGKIVNFLLFINVTKT